MAPFRRLPRLVWGLAPFLMVVAVYASWWLITPTPFSYKGDMYILAAPMAQFSSISWISGHVPALSWLMGDGFNPWMSGQSGVLYPIYPVALLLAKGFGRDYLLLEWTAFLDFLLVAYFIYTSPLFRKSPPWIRLALATLFVAQPAAVILGQNWCYFLNSYTWGILSVGNLLAWYRWPSQTRFAWWTLGSLLVLFTAINAQMFPFFVAICVLPLLLLMGRRHWRRVAAFGLLLGIFLLPPFFCIWWASQNGNPAWMTGRESADSALAFGQSLPTVLKGTIVGNLAGNGFQIWRGVSSWGSGIFYVAPAAVLGLIWSRPRDRYLWGAVSLFLILLMGIASLPFLKWLFIGPFARFRWTWKFAIFIPMVVLGCIALGRPERRPRLWGPLLLVSVALSFWVSSRGLAVDFFPSQVPLQAIGVEGLLSPARELKTRLALKPGERIVPIGRMASMDLPVPAAWLAMIGNAPSLVGIPSMALYDPLEPAENARFRGGLSTPWREAIPDGIDAETFTRIDDYLGPQGAAIYLFKERPRFPMPMAEELNLSNGDALWAVRSRAWRPWAALESGKPAPGPTPWGFWPVPEGDRMRLSTARELTLVPDPGSDPQARSRIRSDARGFAGPWTLRFRPLGRLGPWIGVWYALFSIGFLGAWVKRHPLLEPFDLPQPSRVVSWIHNRSWSGLMACMACAFLVLRLPLLLEPQPISDAIIAYPKQIMAITQQHLVPYAQVPFEYPPLALVPLGLSALVSQGFVWPFRMGLALQMFLVDAALLTGLVLATRRFLQASSPERASATALAAGGLYLVATQPLGCLLYDRLDVAVAACLALPLLLRWSNLATRPWVAGAILACGFWFKLVPMLVLPSLVLWEWSQEDPRTSARRRVLEVLSSFLGVTLGLGLVWQLLFGPKLWTFLGYHLARPVEIGSTWASLEFLLSGGVRPTFEFGGWHLRSQWLPIWRSLSTGLSLAALATTFLLAFRARKWESPLRVCTLAAMGVLLSFVVFGKVFSPQFLLWITPLLPPLIWEKSLPDRLLWVMGGFLGALLTTGLYFPNWHYEVVRGDVAIWLLLILRNGLCLATLIGLWKHLWAPAGPPPAFDVAPVPMTNATSGA